MTDFQFAGLVLVVLAIVFLMDIDKIFKSKKYRKGSLIHMVFTVNGNNRSYFILLDSNKTPEEFHEIIEEYKYKVWEELHGPADLIHLKIHNPK